MNPNDIITLLSDATSQGFFNLFFKAFAILFAVSYLVYGIVITRQTTLMNKTFTTNNSGILYGISFFHIIFGIILIAVSLTLI